MQVTPQGNSLAVLSASDGLAEPPAATGRVEGPLPDANASFILISEPAVRVPGGM